MPHINASLLDFLKKLAANNNKEWFDANRPWYEREKNDHQLVIKYLLGQISTFENLEGLTIKDCSYRINRDIRFSPDKSPYKRNFGCSFEEGGKKSGRAGYYLHIQPGESFLAGGAWGPSKEQIQAIRQEIDYNGEHIKQILSESQFQSVYGVIMGDGLKTAPKGYEKDHEMIDLIKKNQWYAMHKYTDAEVLDPNFLNTVVQHCKIMKPFIDWCNLVCFG